MIRDLKIERLFPSTLVNSFSWSRDGVFAFSNQNEITVMVS